jgi:hypothetical protein
MAAPATLIEGLDTYSQGTVDTDSINPLIHTILIPAISMTGIHEVEHHKRIILPLDWAGNRMGHF